MSSLHLPQTEFGIGRRNCAEPVPAGSADRAIGPSVIAVYAGLALLIFAVFGQTVEHRFINYDDQTYVYENPRITNGLTINGIVTAFVEPHAQNWHPLTTLSHMLDCQLWGLNPGGHHLVNVLLHVATSLLLFGALRSMTSNIWRSALVAAVFAVHPLRVESVAWVAERKDVLSGVFFVLTIMAYAHYVRDQRIQCYLRMLICFALALMSKPTVVTLPLLLLLLDYWPLRRIQAHLRASDMDSEPIQRDRFPFFRSRIFLEKIPLLILSAISAVVTLVVQRQTVAYNQVAPLTARLANAADAYVTYVGQMLWPFKLAVFYPQADGHSLFKIIGAALFLLLVTAVVIRRSERQPFLLVGWCWYVVGLIPVSGFVQVGLQAHADRYTYLPSIGLTLATVWYVADLARLHPLANRWTSTVGLAVIFLLGWRASIQASFWKDSETLWRHALAVTEHNEVAHNNVAAILVKEDRIDEAIVHYQAALRITPRLETHNHLSPAIIENSIGNALAEKGDLEAAIDHYRAALVIRSDFADARSNLSAMLAREGKLHEAVAEYTKVVATPPEDALSHERLATMLVQENRLTEAVSHYRRALQLSPDELDSINALAWILATSSDLKIRNGEEALIWAQRANEISHGNQPVVLRILAAAYAACGRSAEAVQTGQRALALTDSNPALSQALQSEIKAYRMATGRAVIRQSRSTP